MNTTTSITSTFNKRVIQASISSLAVTLNLLVLLVLARDRKLLKRSAFLFGLAMGNLLVALAFFVSAIHRIAMMLSGMISVHTTISFCLMTLIPELYYLAFCVPSLVLLGIGVERFVAVKCAGWYFTKWAPGKNWYVLGIVCICSLVSAGVVCIWGLLYVQGITYECLWTRAAGDGFAAYFYMVSIVGGVCAVIATLVAFWIGRYRLKNLPVSYSTNETRKRAQKQLQLTKAMLSVACLDFCFVVTPNVFLLLTVVFNVTIVNASTYALYAYNANAVLNMLGHVVFNSEFRKSAIKFFRCDRCEWFKKFGTATAVVPTTAQSLARRS